MSTKWSTVTSPYIPDAVVPAPHLGFVQVKGSQSFQIGLGDGLGHVIWWAISMQLYSNGLYKNLEEETGTL
jgi:hypothetical protein